MDVHTEKMNRELRAFADVQGRVVNHAPRSCCWRQAGFARINSDRTGSNSGERSHSPAQPSIHLFAEAANHEASVRLAEQTYYKDKKAMPVEVTTYPWNVERTANKKRDMGH